MKNSNTIILGAGITGLAVNLSSHYPVIERAYQGEDKLSEEAIAGYSKDVVKELSDWGFIKEVEVVGPRVLEDQSISQGGRYGLWVFQGIADSTKDRFFVGASFRTYQ